MSTDSARLELDKATLALLARLTALAGRDALYAELDPFMAKQALIGAGHVSKTQLSGNVLRRRTGSLARSIVGIGLRQNGVPALKIGVLRGPALKYAGTLEEGTVGAGGDRPTIVPRKGKALAMPVGEALTPAGVARYTGPRDYPGELKFVPFRKSGIAIGALYDARKLKAEQKRANKAGRPVDLQEVGSLYLLLRKIDVKPYRYLRNGFGSYLPRLTLALKAELKRILSKQK